MQKVMHEDSSTCGGLAQPRSPSCHLFSSAHPYQGGLEPIAAVLGREAG